MSGLKMHSAESWMSGRNRRAATSVEDLKSSQPFESVTLCRVHFIFDIDKWSLDNNHNLYDLKSI